MTLPERTVKKEFALPPVCSYCLQGSMSNHKSTTTKNITIRLKNADVELLDLMVEAGGFKDRSECLRAFIKPMFEMAKDAMVKKKVRLNTLTIGAKEFAELKGHFDQMARSSDVQGELFGDVPEVGVATA